MSPVVDFRLMAITDRLGMRSVGSLLRAVDAALVGGTDAVQLREKDLLDAEFVMLARQLRALTTRRGARLLVNGRPRIAREVGADGIHLPSGGADVAGTRAVLGEGGVVGVSAHSIADVIAAHRDGADYVTFGPVFATPSKAAFGEPLGVEALCEACRSVPMPVFALGGIKPDRAAEIAATGARVAAIGALLFAPDPAMAAKSFLAVMEAPA